MINMSKQQIYPAINGYISKLLKAYNLKKDLYGENLASTDLQIAKRLTELNFKIFVKCEELESLLDRTKNYKTEKELAFFFKDKVLKCMKELRSYSDEAENLTSEKYWPFPSYGQILFSVK